MAVKKRKVSTKRGKSKVAKRGAKGAKARATSAKRPAAKRPKARAAGKKPPVMDEAAMMAAWQKAATPAEGHRRLEPLAGSFRAKTTFVMAPGQPASVSDATSEHRWVLGGRYLEQVYRGETMGMPFEGVGYTGYDNVQRRYVGVWMDNFGTGLMYSVGVGRPTDSAMNFEATVFEPTGQRKFSCKVAIQDRDHHTYEMWTTAPNGRKFRMMLCEYTRA